jgi:putative SOS response-associated peptidase YedK
MCGRFVESRSASELAEELEIDEVLAELPDGSSPAGGVDEAVPPRWNIAPTLPVWAVTAKADEAGEVHRRLRLYHWGLVPSWSRSPASGNRTFNARAESLFEKSMFATPLARRRCIVPADAFYEWRREPGGGRGRAVRKEPWCFRAADGKLMGFAGLWEFWRERRDDGEEAPMLRSCTIVTTESTGAVARIHDRCPVVLPREAWDEWLAPGPLEAPVLSELLAPAPEDLLVGYPVSRRVNDAREEGPELVEPAEAGAGEGGGGGDQTLFEV